MDADPIKTVNREVRAARAILRQEDGGSMMEDATDGNNQR